MSTIATWPAQAESWLDERGKGAWIVAMILGFVFFWPIGLAILSLEFTWARVWLKRMRESISNFSSNKRKDRAEAQRQRVTPD